jgi:hypothetical protein
MRENSVDFQFEEHCSTSPREAQSGFPARRGLPLRVFAEARPH